MIGAAVIAFGFWVLMTGDITPDNLLIGILGAAAAARLPSRRVTLRQYLRMGWRTLAAIPRAYGQAVQLMIFPHIRERSTWESGSRDPRDRFERIFLITLTPKSTATGTDDRGRIRVHYLERKKP